MSEYGNGSIFKRSDGRWCGVLVVGHDANGKAKRKYIYGKTKKAVREAMNELRVEVQKKTYVDPSRMTFEELAGEWLELYTVNVKPRTLESYQSLLKNHIIPKLGRYKLTDMDTRQIQDFVNHLERRDGNEGGLSAKTVSNIVSLLREIFKRACQLGYIRTNPASLVVLPRKGSKSTVNPLKPEQVSEFLNAISGSKYEIPLTLDLFTGLRRGELCGLLWDCVDLEKGTLLINKQLNKDPIQKKLVLVSTKTDNVRTIVIPPYLVELLKKQREWQDEQRQIVGTAWNNPEGFVFTNEIGGHITPERLYVACKNALRSIGCPTTRLHDLRHTYATICLENGDDVKTLQQNLGHSNISTTLQIYADASKRMKERSAERMQDFINDHTKGNTTNEDSSE